MPKLTDYVDYLIIWTDPLHTHYGRLKNGELVPVTPTIVDQIIDMINLREEVIRIEIEKGLKYYPHAPK